MNEAFCQRLDMSQRTFEAAVSKVPLPSKEKMGRVMARIQAEGAHRSVCGIIRDELVLWNWFAPLINRLRREWLLMPNHSGEAGFPVKGGQSAFYSIWTPEYIAARRDFVAFTVQLFQDRYVNFFCPEASLTSQPARLGRRLAPSSAFEAAYTGGYRVRSSIYGEYLADAHFSAARDSYGTGEEPAAPVAVSRCKDRSGGGERSNVCFTPSPPVSDDGSYAGQCD